MDTANLDQVEFLKGPSALMSGIMAIGGSVNYVSKQPTSGPDSERNRLSARFAGHVPLALRLGRQHRRCKGLDYRFDAVGSKINSFIDGDYRDLADLSAQLNYRVNRRLQDVCGHRIQKRFRPCLLGHAARPDLLRRFARRQRRRLRQCSQHVLRLDHRAGDDRLPHADHQLQRRRQCHRRPRALAAQRISNGRRSTTSPSRIRSITIRPSAIGSTAKPMPSTTVRTSRPAPSTATASS